MKHFTTSLLAVCAFFAVISNAQGQVFYQQLFDSPNLPSGWTNTDASGNAVLWSRCTNLTTECHSGEYNVDPFEGSDVANGFMILDSDEAGQLSAPHQSRLTSAAINCSGKNEVYAVFENFIGVFDYSADDNARLFVSNNGTTWTSFQVFQGVEGGGATSLSENPLVSGIDISSVAANQATVYLRWEWVGNYEYWWILDNVSLTTVNPTPDNDLSVADFFYPVSSYATPESQIGIDTFAFEAYISNLGTQPQTNLKVYAYVLEYDPNTGSPLGIIHIDSISIPELAPGVDSFQVSFNERFAPELPVGLYAVAYEVAADAADQHDADNFKGDFFEVTDLLFAKENGPQSASRPADGGDWAVGNYYRMGEYNETLDQFSALGATFSFAVNAPTLPGDINVELSLYRLNDDVLDDFSNFEGDGSSMTLIGTAPFDTPDDAANYDLFDAEIFDLNSGLPGVPLEPNGRYILSAGYVGTSAEAFTAFNSNVYANFVSTILYIGGEWGGNFVGRPNAVLRMNLDLTTSTDVTPLAETALAVSPNPTADYVNLKVNFTEPTNATITIADINGRVIRTENRKGMLDETVNYQIKDFASGTYLARIATAKGTRTLKFVVQK